VISMATDSSYMIAPGETQSSIDMRRKLALALHQQAVGPQKIDHWTQGLAQLANAGITGYEMHSIDKADREEAAKGNALMAQLLGGGQGASVSPASASTGGNAPMAAALARPNTPPDKIYANDEPSPLDPPSGEDRDRLIRTVLAESNGQGPTGMNAVASVVRNRAVDGGYGGNTPSGVVTAPNQFEPWNTAAGRSKMAAINPNSPQFAAAGQAVDQAYFGNDPTNGATHFYAPKAQAALGRDPPKWDNGTGVDIKDHRFFGGANPQTQVADNGALPPNAQPTQGYAVPGGAAPQGGPNRELLIQMLGNRKTAPMAQQILGQQISAQMKPETTDDIKEFNYAQRNPAFKQHQIDLKRASAQNINLDQRGENAFAKKAGEVQATRFNELAQGGQDAQQMLGDLNSLREIGGRITTGKTAEIQNAIGPYAEALRIKMDGLDDMQAYNAIVAKLAPRMRVPGSGATSDFEMQNFLKALPGLGKTPGGNEMIANTLEAVSQQKIAAAEIASRAMAGEITPREAEKELRALPDPLTLWKKEGKNLKPAAAAPAAPVAKPMPQAGAIMDGYRFKGGDPSMPESWELAQ